MADLTGNRTKDSCLLGKHHNHQCYVCFKSIQLGCCHKTRDVNGVVSRLDIWLWSILHMEDICSVDIYANKTLLLNTHMYIYVMFIYTWITDTVTYICVFKVPIRSGSMDPFFT